MLEVLIPREEGLLTYNPACFCHKDLLADEIVLTGQVALRSKLFQATARANNTIIVCKAALVVMECTDWCEGDAGIILLLDTSPCKDSLI